jgi:hypothetical protein
MRQIVIEAETPSVMVILDGLKNPPPSPQEARRGKRQADEAIHHLAIRVKDPKYS